MRFTSIVRVLVPPTVADEAPWKLVVRIFLYLAVAFLGFFLLIQLVPVAVIPGVRGTAWLSTQLLRLCGAQAWLDGITVSMNAFSFTIIYECTGVFSSLIFSSCVLAYPATLKRKMLGIAWGIPTILVVNLVRVAALTAVGNYHYDYFDLLHGYLWQVTIILIVGALWVVWMMGAARDGS